ncbi:hypothetical protein G4B88_026882 [Cannabis sativa]|uniref:Uncharacterized protein n=1 Tax=Cannabis sativa TaxID=3483 RepID=A0A7J6FGK3_CANSA|nr:hypothetical protein G4B88_026882 [Cannabis sativa]
MDVAPQLLKKPPKLYESIIDLQQWREFVAMRLSPDFEVRRKMAQQSREKYIYNHRTKQGGVRMVQEQMEKEVGHQITKFYRSEILKGLHMNTNGEVEGPAMEIVQWIATFNIPKTHRKLTISKDVAPQLLKKPPKLYESIIDLQQWREFVAMRLTPDFEVRRKMAQQSREKYIYNHRTKQGGVRMVQEQMEKEVGHQITKFYRSEILKGLHMNTNGEVEGPAMEIVQWIDYVDCVSIKQY